MIKARLGVNIDHVATLRQARDEGYPSTETAAKIALDNGADQITIHLREDRRHIQDHDVATIRKVTTEKNKLFNFEMGCTAEMVSIAIDVKPDWVCLVPEKREEKTTEGGLDLISDAGFERVKNAVLDLQEHTPKTKISLFVEADEIAMNRAKELKVDAVEIHTGSYAKDFLENKDYQSHLEKYRQAHKLLEGSGVCFHAGHGLTLDSVKPLVDLDLFEEYNIGHWIVAQAVFDGLGSVVKSLRHKIDGEVI